MKQKSLFNRIVIPYLVLIMLSLVITSVIASYAFRTFYINQLVDDLEAQANLILLLLPDTLSENSASFFQLDGNPQSVRVSVVLPGGKVIFDSEENPVKMDNHADRPEIIEALLGKRGHSTRYSHTLRHSMLYVAIPAVKNNKMAGVVRVSMTITAIDNNLKKLNIRVAFIGAIVLILAFLTSLVIAQKISSPLKLMQKGAEKFAEGKLGARVPESDTKELTALARALNKMAAELDDRMKTIERHRVENETILAAMVEGIIAIDPGEHIIMLNRSAGKLLNIDEKAAIGKTMQEALRNAQLLQFARQVLDSKETSIEDEITIYQEEEIILLANGAHLDWETETKPGAVIVLNDVTRVRQLEQTRRDFVINASHELKTPITAIKGFVETLLDGTAHKPEDIERILGIVARQADYLSAIASDLLSLARLESDDKTAWLAFEDKNVCDILEEVVGIYHPVAEKAGQKISLDCSGDIHATLNSILMEQAIMNLVENVIKHCPEGTQISIKGRIDSETVYISVQDNGQGISSENIPRIFERFYRIDKSRSRSLGGTGLGLAIVKHIALVHNGQINVESSRAKGSTFTISFPRKTDDS
ncbi:MAG: ATP-binding protein [Candidatus Electryonea clarkiae]|nr:ATP-binding protein [Candidatus Electryonea clarkiae]MDP8288314.1 ATP-binding protein [Candidatus Electryonea clarkiae]